jgi:hypothetical protein
MVTLEQIFGIFEHPLTLLLIGAGLSSLLIPWFTNRWQDHRKKLEIKVDIASKMAQATGPLLANAAISTRGNFSEIKIVTGYILVIFASMQLQILLISIRSTDEQFCRMGSLAWLGYLSYTQVVESSNLSPSIIYCSASFLAIHLAEMSQKIVHPIQM